MHTLTFIFICPGVSPSADWLLSSHDLMGVLEARAILTQGCSNTSNSKLLYDTVYNLQKVSVFRSVARWHDLGRTSQLEGRGDYTENDRS